MHGSIIGGTDVMITVCTAVSLVVQMSQKRYVRQYYWWYRCDDSGMYGSIIGGTDDSGMYGSTIGCTDDSGMYGSTIGGTDVTIAVCTTVLLVVQM